MLLDGLDEVPAEAVIRLVDHALDKTIDLSDSQTYVFQLGERTPVSREADARFTLLIGSADYVAKSLPGPPARTALYPNRPNPFNPATSLAYEVPRAGKVTLAIYDVRGRLVRRLAAGFLAPGVNRFTWDGRDDRGRSAPSGVYLARLSDGLQWRSRRLVLVR